MGFFTPSSGTPAIAMSTLRRGDKISGVVVPSQSTGAPYDETQQTAYSDGPPGSTVKKGDKLTYDDGSPRMQAEVTLFNETAFKDWAFMSDSAADAARADTERKDNHLRRMFVQGKNIKDATIKAFRAAKANDITPGQTITWTFLGKKQRDDGKSENLWECEISAPTTETLAVVSRFTPATGSLGNTDTASDDGEAPF